MSDDQSAVSAPIRLRRYMGFLVICWTIAVVATLTWEILDEQSQAVDAARSEARGAWKNEAAIRRWNAANGGVYVPQSEETRPDPHLAQLPERDITTPSGQKLTLVNPAAIVRHIQEATREEFDVQGHITSLRPIDPRNAPDAWEKEALEAFELGQSEVHSVQTIAGERYLRLMRPLITEQSCLKCHAEHGYKAGDIRGGISVSVPMASTWTVEREQIIHRMLGYGGMWLLGVGGIFALSRQLRRQIDCRYQAERKLQEINDLLEHRVAERTAELASVNKELENEIAERKQAEQWLLENEQRFRSCFEQGLVGMAILSANQEWVEVNQRLCKLLGYLEEELIGKTWAEFIAPEDRPAEETDFKRMLGGVVNGYHMERRIFCKNGKAFHANLSMQCMRKEDGTVDCVLALVQESDRHQPQPAASPRPQ
jgi:PAS domain S-box-containing protein